MTHNLSTTHKFLSSIFQHEIEEGYTWLKNVMFNRPGEHKTLCLEGEGHTGKSSFGSLLKILDPKWAWNINDDAPDAASPMIYICDQGRIVFNDSLREIQDMPGCPLVLITNKLHCEKADDKIWKVAVQTISKPVECLEENMIAERTDLMNFLRSYGSSDEYSMLQSLNSFENPIESISQKLYALRPNITKKDRKEFMENWDVSRVTISRYLNGNAACTDLATQMFAFFKSKIDHRNKLLVG